MYESTLRPGYLVSLNTSVKGGVFYRKQLIEAAHLDDDGQERERWETERVVTDPKELEEAYKVRGKVRGLIGAVCARSAFGLLCPEDRKADLDEAVAQAEALAAEFNADASTVRIWVFVMTGWVASDDEEAARKITRELRMLMTDMTEGMQGLDVKRIRDAADRATSVGEMLTPEAQGRLQVAIETARKTARQIVKAGEQAAIEVDRSAIAKIEMARTSFLDLDTATPIEAPVAVAQRAIDFDASEGTVAAPSSSQAREIEVGA